MVVAFRYKLVSAADSRHALMTSAVCVCVHAVARSGKEAWWD